MATDQELDAGSSGDPYEIGLARAQWAAENEASALDVPALRKVADDIDRSTLPIICDVLRRLRAFQGATAEMPLETIVNAMPIIPKYIKLGRRWLIELAEEGVLLRGEQGFRAHRLYQVPAATMAENPHFRSISTMLMNVMTGKHHVLEYVFGALRPNWLSAYTATAYDADPIFAYQHRIVTALVGAFADRSSPSSPLRILEVGAGTGSLTAQLLSQIPTERLRYLCTDVAREFLELAKQRFRHAEGAVSYSVFDINKPLADNKIEPGQFDFIVAFDVLHCARDLGKTLGWLRSLLACRGILVNEQLTRNRLGHLIFPGIMPGFTDFEDDRLRDYRTLPTPAAWYAALSVSGFSRCHILPQDARLLEELGHGVIIAQAV